MTSPWIAKPARPELTKDPVTGLYPGQKHEHDIPGFLRRVRMPDGRIVVGLENISLSNSPPGSTQASPLPWASMS